MLILMIILVIVVVIVLFAVRTVQTNVKEMDRSVQAGIDTIGKYFPVRQLDCGKYKNIKVKGMNFAVSQYRAEGLGNLSVMKMNAGMMQMGSLILDPVDRDVPLLSMDYMYILGKRKTYFEIYDLVLEKSNKYQLLMNSIRDIRNEYGELVDFTAASSWADDLRTECIYKNGKAKDDIPLYEMTVKGCEAMMRYASEMPLLNEEEHQCKVKMMKEYSHGLIEKGGVSTDAFVKELGAEATGDFFDKVLFKAE